MTHNDQQNQANTGNRIIRLKDVMEKTGLSKTSVYRLAGDKASDFPGSVQLTEATVGWYESEIDAWIASRTPPTAPLRGKNKPSEKAGMETHP